MKEEDRKILNSLTREEEEHYRSGYFIIKDGRKVYRLPSTRKNATRMEEESVRNGNYVFSDD